MEGEKENPQCYKEVGRARSYEEQTNSSSSKLMFSGTEFNFQQNLLSALQACLKGKLRHLHFMRYSSHIQICSQHRGFTTTIWHFQLEQLLTADFVGAHVTAAPAN